MRLWIWIVAIVGAALLAAAPLLGDAVLIQYGINALSSPRWRNRGTSSVASPATPPSAIRSSMGWAPTARRSPWSSSACPSASASHSARLLAMLCALLIGFPVLRLQGHYFAIATLGVSAAMQAIIANLDIAGANIGLVLPLTRADNMFYELALGAAHRLRADRGVDFEEPLRRRADRHPRG